ncbi:hypothetical protein ACXET9_02295 [Brachybacterium sp. DNPG3]
MLRAGLLPEALREGSGGVGGVDVAAEIGWSGMQPMTDEAIIDADPDLLLMMTKASSPAEASTACSTRSRRSP